MGHDYEDQARLTLDASPEEVWEAIATGPGMDAWFMGRTEVQPGEEGRVRADMGGFVQEFDVTAWEPPRRLKFETRPTENGSFIALEWLIEARSGSTVLRSVGSGFIGSDDWSDEYDALRQGGVRYLRNLSQYLTHFRGRPAVPINAAWPHAGSRDEMWSALRRGLDLPEQIEEGNQVRLSPKDFAPIDGVIDYATPAGIGIRGEEGLYRFFRGMGGLVAIEHHLFGDDIDARATQQAWQSWLASQLT
jgi:uncharacterized protein YndB with AHSA1/START domain